MNKERPARSSPQRSRRVFIRPEDYVCFASVLGYERYRARLATNLSTSSVLGYERYRARLAINLST